MLGNLYEYLFSLAEKVLNRKLKGYGLLQVLTEDGVIKTREHVSGMQKGCLFKADIHEGRLHAGQDLYDLALVDITDKAGVFFPFNIELGQLRTVFKQRHPR